MFAYPFGVIQSDHWCLCTRKRYWLPMESVRTFQRYIESGYLEAPLIVLCVTGICGSLALGGMTCQSCCCPTSFLRAIIVADSWPPAILSIAFEKTNTGIYYLSIVCRRIPVLSDFAILGISRGHNSWLETVLIYNSLWQTAFTCWDTTETTCCYPAGPSASKHLPTFRLHEFVAARD